MGIGILSGETLKGKEGCSGNDGGNLVRPLPQAQWIRATRGEAAAPDSVD